MPIFFIEISHLRQILFGEKKMYFTTIASVFHTVLQALCVIAGGVTVSHDYIHLSWAAHWLGVKIWKRWIERETNVRQVQNITGWFWKLSKLLLLGYMGNVKIIEEKKSQMTWSKIAPAWLRHLHALILVHTTPWFCINFCFYLSLDSAQLLFLSIFDFHPT